VTVPPLAPPIAPVATPTAKASEARLLFGLWLIALAARFAGVVLGILILGDMLVAEDSHGVYLPIAQNLAAGKGYQFYGTHYDATRIPPLYPIWLALLMATVGPQVPLWLSGLFNAAFRAGGCVLLYLLARRYFGERAARWAFALYLLDPWEALWVGYLLKESLAVPLFLLGVWQLGRLADAPSGRTAALAGATIGLATLARYPSGALWIAGLLVVIWILRREGGGARHLLRRGVRLVAALTTGMLLVLSPWLVRNWRVTGQPVLSTHFVGRYFYTSNSPSRVLDTRGYAEAQGLDFALLRRTNAEQKPIQGEGRLFLHALRELLGRPDHIIVRIATKVANMWRPTFGVSSLRNLLILALPYCVLMLLALGGIVVAVRQRLPCLAIVAPLAVMIAIHLVFWAEVRNRQYPMPLLHAFGGLAVARLLALGTRRMGPEGCGTH